MRILIQLATGLVVLAIGLVVFVWTIPGAPDLAVKLGVPRSMLAAIGKPYVERKAGEPAPGIAGQTNGRRGPSGPPVVVVREAGMGRTNDRVKAIGDGDAIRSVTVTPLVAGQISKLLVHAGQKVNEGDVIARLDDDAEKIAVEKSRVALQSANNTLARNEGLKKIISQADLQDAQSTVETAKLALAEAELNLKRRAIVAPISGVAGIVSVTEGDYVTVSSAIVTIDDRSRLLVDFWVPERFSSLLAEGQPITATAISRPGQAVSGKIVAIDNRIDAASRTLRLQAEIANDSDSLRAGQAFEVGIALAGDTWPSVEPLSIQWDSQGSFVWRIRDKKAERVAVTIIERNPESVLVKADIAKGDKIVIEGLQRLRAGAEVRLQGEGDPAGKDGKKPDDKTADAAGQPARSLLK
jgi:RND family efflux transporter MFP subunit